MRMNDYASKHVTINEQPQVSRYENNNYYDTPNQNYDPDDDFNEREINNPEVSYPTPIIS